MEPFHKGSCPLQLAGVFAFPVGSGIRQIPCNLIAACFIIINRFHIDIRVPYSLQSHRFVMPVHNMLAVCAGNAQDICFLIHFQKEVLIGQPFMHITYRNIRIEKQRIQKIHCFHSYHLFNHSIFK